MDDPNHGPKEVLISTWTIRPATYKEGEELSISIPHLKLVLVRLTEFIRDPFLRIRGEGLLSRWWAIVVIALFVFISNSPQGNSTSLESIAVMEPTEVTESVRLISLYTLPLEESLDQLNIALTGESFIGSDKPGELPKEYSHTVAKGETMAAIAKNYNVYVSDILRLNGIKPEDAARVKVGQVLRVPAEAGEQDLTWLQLANEARRRAEEEARRARLAAAAARVPRTALTRGANGGNVEILGREPRGRNTYPFGWCTYWVASKRYVPPRWGNAKNWLASARAAGWATGREPRVGAIVSTTDNWYYGHVAYVEAITDGSIVVSEMNYVRWGVVNRRTIPIGSPIIRGYIY